MDCRAAGLSGNAALLLLVEMHFRATQFQAGPMYYLLLWCLLVSLLTALQARLVVQRDKCMLLGQWGLLAHEAICARYGAGSGLACECCGTSQLPLFSSGR
jgi:hypothetical protein